MKRLCNGLLGSAVLGALVLHFPTGQSAQAREKTLYSFCSQDNCNDGDAPVAGLINVSGALYGTTPNGGNSLGTVFSLDAKTGAETVIHAFSGSDGISPEASLIDVNGTLYGTTSGGGSESWGTVFSLDPSTGAETVLHSFARGADGADPMASLINVKGTLYGTTYAGGTGVQCTASCGTVFSVDPNTGAEKVLYSFCSQQACADGAEPLGALVEVDGALYGTTSTGGTGEQACVALACGIVFAIDRKTGVETVVHSFCSQQNCVDGQSPGNGLINVGGTLYGTTLGGGAYEGGTVFAIDPNTSVETVLYSFCSRRHCTDGSGPSNLIDFNGALYGTTESGGAHNNAGTAFSLDLTTGVETVLHSFCSQQNCTDGQKPLAGLLARKATLYGTTEFGGANGQGTVFALKTR